MKINEIRVGNYFEGYSGSNFQWSVDDFCLLATNAELDEIIREPIPLDEGWLIKFGFEIDRDRYVKDLYWISLEGDFGVIVPIEYNLYEELAYCKHVHQLQNLYFALTGQELEVKELVNNN